MSLPGLDQKAETALKLWSEVETLASTLDTVLVCVLERVVEAGGGRGGSPRPTYSLLEGGRLVL